MAEWNERSDRARPSWKFGVITVIAVVVLGNVLIAGLGMVMSDTAAIVVAVTGAIGCVLAWCAWRQRTGT